MQITSHIGVLVLLMVSFVMVLIVVNVGEDIVENTPQSKIFDAQRNAQKTLQEK